MIFLIWSLLVITIALGMWLSTIERSMHQVNPIALQHELELSSTPKRAIWISKNFEIAVQSLSFFQIILFASSVILLSVVISGNTISWLNMFIGLGVAAALNWFLSSVVAGAIAYSIPIGVIKRGWLAIQVVSIFGPLTKGIVNFIGEITRRLTGANLKDVVQDNGVEEQLLRSIEHSQREGGIPAEAAKLLHNVVDLGSTDVGEIMTPRTDIEGIEFANNLSEIRAFVLDSGRSRIPVFKENLDQIIGILYVKDLVPYLGAEAEGFELSSILRKPIVVPDTKLVQDLLADFQKSEVHMAVVIDEYGGTSGLVTIEDVLEEIVGEIRDEHDDTEIDEPEILRVSATTIEVDGRFNLDDLNDALSIKLPEDEEYDTVAGFVLANLGHVPEVGETLEIQNMRFTALNATSTQIERLAIELPVSD